MKNKNTIIIIATIAAIAFYLYIRIKNNTKRELFLKKQKFAEKKAKVSSFIALNQLKRNSERQKAFEEMQKQQWKFVRTGKL